jgi:chemotaxis signal transduction protein
MTIRPQPRSPQRATLTAQALVFRLGQARLAVPADQVATVAAVEGCTRIPCDDPALLGVARVGHRLLPLIDAHRRMQVAGGVAAPFPCTCVVVRGALGEVGFRIDELLGLYAAPDGLLPPGCAPMPLEQLIDGGGVVADGE